LIRGDLKISRGDFVVAKSCRLWFDAPTKNVKGINLRLASTKLAPQIEDEPLTMMLIKAGERSSFFAALLSPVLDGFDQLY